MKSSRPRKVQEAIDKLASFPKDTSALTEKQKREATGAKNRANWELSLEQAIAEKAAERDPKVAAVLLKESLKKGVSDRAVGLLEKIADADMEMAQGLKSELVGKLVDSAVNQNDYGLNRALRTALESATKNKDKESVFETSDLEVIANKLADYMLKQESMVSQWTFETDSALVLKYAPNRKSDLERRRKVNEARMRPWERESAKVFKIYSDKSLSGKELIEKAAQFRGGTRGGLYTEAINRASKNGKLNEVRTELENAPPSAQRDKALNDLGEKESQAALKSSDTEKIEQILDSATTDIARLKVLSRSAISLYQSKEEDQKKRAVEYLNEAKDIAGDRIVTREDVLNQLELIPAVATIEPASMFEKLEKLVSLVNKLTAASAVMREYDNRTPYTYEGEYFFPNIFTKSYEEHGSTLKSVADEDLGELLEVTRRFNTPELRLLSQYAILQGIHEEKLGFPENRPMFFSRYSNDL